MNGQWRVNTEHIEELNDRITIKNSLPMEKTTLRFCGADAFCTPKRVANKCDGCSVHQEFVHNSAERSDVFSMSQF